VDLPFLIRHPPSTPSTMRGRRRTSDSLSTGLPAADQPRSPRRSWDRVPSGMGSDSVQIERSTFGYDPTYRHGDYVMSAGVVNRPRARWRSRPTMGRLAARPPPGRPLPAHAAAPGGAAELAPAVVGGCNESADVHRRMDAAWRATLTPGVRSTSLGRLWSIVGRPWRCCLWLPVSCCPTSIPGSPASGRSPAAMAAASALKLGRAGRRAARVAAVAPRPARATRSRVTRMAGAPPGRDWCQPRARRPALPIEQFFPTFDECPSAATTCRWSSTRITDLGVLPGKAATPWTR
jgi:hypothetical protein